jgi:hypothetical protein
VGILASQDHTAVDDPGDDRGELARRDRDHRLVEQPQTLVEAPELDQDLALLMRCEGEQVGVAEALADRGGLAGGDRSRLPVAARLLLEYGWQQQVAALDSVASLAVQQPPGAPQPAARAAELSVAGEGHADPECAADGGELGARLQVGAMRALEQLSVLGLAADHVGAGGEQLEVRRSQRIRSIRSRQRRICVRPGLRRIRLTTPPQLGHRFHNGLIIAAYAGGHVMSLGAQLARPAKPTPHSPMRLVPIPRLGRHRQGLPGAAG